MKFLISALCVLVLAGCATQEAAPEKQEAPPPPLEEIQTEAPAVPRIDYTMLQQQVGLTYSRDHLGYAERGFDACSLPVPFAHPNDCKHAKFILLQFQLVCRDTEGTTSVVVTPADTRPIANQNLKWKIKNLEGVLTTDQDGYGQVRAITASSMQKEHVRMTLGEDFVYLSLVDVSRIMTPVSWCR